MATIKQKKTFKKLSETQGNIGKAMREAGYSEVTSKTPQNLTESKGWGELIEKHLSDESLSKVHKELLNSHHLDHMTFPVEVIDDGKTNTKKKRKIRDEFTDEDIYELLASTNCKVRKIVHGETARHVYFWSPDNKARDSALDKAYKLKGKYAPEKSQSIHVNIDASPDDPRVKKLAKRFEDELKNLIVEDIKEK